MTENRRPKILIARPEGIREVDIPSNVPRHNQVFEELKLTDKNQLEKIFNDENRYTLR